TPVLAGRPPPGPVRPAPALNTSAPTAIRPKEEAMTSAVPTAAGTTTAREFRLNMCGPDFPFAYDTYLNSPAGLGQVPAEHHGTEVAVIGGGDRKSTRLNSSHVSISYAVFCLKKKNEH